MWESVNKPYKLPDDLKSFYLISNGIRLTWNIIFQQKEFPLGLINIDSLSSLNPLDISIFPNFEGIYNHPHVKINKKIKKYKIFQLDSTCTWGTIGLVYIDNYNNPQIWFQDVSGEWYYIAPSFTDYFRLIVIHLGIPKWHFAYTEYGLDPITIQWFRFVNPDRLNIIMNYWKSKREIDDSIT